MANQIFSYTKRDYEGSRKEALSKIPYLSGGVWTDLNATDPGIIILDYVHALVDMVNFYQDHQALESFLVTAKERANILRLAKQLSYKVRSATGAKVYVTIHTDFYYNYPIKIPKHTKVRTADNISFITTEDAYIESGKSEVTVLCEQGTLYTKEYIGTGLSRFSNVDPPANQNQSITLTVPNIVIDSISIKDNLGRLWNPVDFIVFSTGVDRVYQVDLDPTDSVTIKFGDGQRGVVPQVTDTLTISYLVSDAENGRVGIGAIRYIDPIYDKDNQYIELTVTNKEASVGGSSPQSEESIKETAPGAIKAQDRAVTLDDYVALSKLVEGVVDARAYDINTNRDIPFHVVKVLIIPEDKASGSVILKNVYDYLYKRVIPPTNLQVTLPSEIVIDISITVKSIDSVDKGELEYKIISTVKDYFKNKSHIIGEDFYPTDLSTVIANIPNVKYIVSMTPNNVISIQDLSIAELGNLTVIVE